MCGEVADTLDNTNVDEYRHFAASALQDAMATCLVSY